MSLHRAFQGWEVINRPLRLLQLPRACQNQQLHHRLRDKTQQEELGSWNAAAAYRLCHCCGKPGWPSKQLFRAALGHGCAVDFPSDWVQQLSGIGNVLIMQRNLEVCAFAKSRTTLSVCSCMGPESNWRKNINTTSRTYVRSQHLLFLGFHLEV